MNRAKRRRERQAEDRARRRAGLRQPVIIAGDGIIAQSLGQAYEAIPGAKLPDKEPGVHRWVALGAWRLALDPTAILDGDRLKLLDHENLLYLSIGCWDCEQPITDDAAREAPCTGDPREL